MDQHDREVAAKVWDEAIKACYDSGIRANLWPGNPYLSGVGPGTVYEPTLFDLPGKNDPR